MNEKESRKIGWWDKIENIDKVISATYKIFREICSDKHTSILKAGCKLLGCALTTNLDLCTDEINTLQAGSMYTEYANTWAD